MRNLVLAMCVMGLLAGMACAQSTTAAPCPAYNSFNNTNLACEFATAFKAPALTAQNASGATQSINPVVLSTTLASQLATLPVATAVSGTGITFVNGIPTRATDTLGTILTERGDTLGKGQIFLSFNYQRFGFGGVDGVKFRSFETVNTISFGSSGTSYNQANNRIDFNLDQFTALGTYGLTNRIDLTLVVPFSKVTLKTQSSGTQYNADANGNLITSFPTASTYLAGSKTGVGDVTVSLKMNVKRFNNGTSMAFGTDVRIPTGDETNYLGTGAWGVRPFFILSHHKEGGRLTPNVNIGYLYNGSSSLYTDPATGNQLNLPQSISYSGGSDFRVFKRLTLVGEFIGTYVINGPRIEQTTVGVPTQVGSATKTSFKSINVTQNGKLITQNYFEDNISPGIKFSPFRNVSISANALLKLDDGGLRSKVVPLAGISYSF
jgi:hypothetical protein